MRLRDFQPDFNKKLKMLTELLTEVTETVQSPRAKAFLSSALQFVRPHHLSLGLRISRLSTTHVEVQVPLLGKSEAHEAGTLVTAATLAAQLLLRRVDQPDIGPCEVQEVRFERLGALTSSLSGRLEFSKLAQENLRAELRKAGSAELELTLSFFDANERREADCTLKYLCRSADQIAWKGQDGRSANSN